MNVMKRAWEIAREGQEKFGGKVKEYFAMALKMAWEEVNEAKHEVKSYEYTLPVRKGLWVAEIVGTHPKFKLERRFLKEDYIEDNSRVFLLYDGIYDIKYSNKGRMFVKVENGNIEDISYDEVIQLATDMGIAA